VNVVHVGVGPISQSDVDLAQACGAYIVGFNVKSPPSSISQAAIQAGTKVLRLLSLIIYVIFNQPENMRVHLGYGWLIFYRTI
jgi:translation initiation factor IF-2